MVADALPGAARRDPLALVVVAVAAARGEGVAQPEAVLRRHRVGGVGEMRRALVGGDDEVGIVVVVADHVGRVHDLALHQVVGDVEEAGHELAVALDQVRVQRRPRRQLALQHEAALRPDRDDDGVLQLLRLHQPEDLGAEVVVAIAPAQAAARDHAAAQVDAFQLARVHVDLEQRPRRGHAVDLAAGHLDRHHRPLRPLIGVGPQRGVHQVLEPAQDLVVEQAGDRVHLAAQRRRRRARWSLRACPGRRDRSGRRRRDRWRRRRRSCAPARR